MKSQEENIICRHYEQTLPKSGSPNAAVLDICSSWISHFPADYKLDRVAGEALAEQASEADMSQVANGPYW